MSIKINMFQNKKIIKVYGIVSQFCKPHCCLAMADSWILTSASVFSLGEILLFWLKAIKNKCPHIDMNAVEE